MVSLQKAKRAGLTLFHTLPRVITALCMGAGAAFAQSPVCNQIRSELASLAYQQNAANPQIQAEAAQVRNDLARVRIAIQRNECDRGFQFFTSTPAVCSPLKAQAQQFEGRLRALDNAANSSPVAQRRGQLLAALDRYQCNIGTSQQVQRPPGVISGGPQQEPNLIERLFGSRPSQPGTTSNATVDPRFPQNQDGEVLENKPTYGGRMAVCVRTCDGYFFPINFEGISQRDDYDQVCKALCPAAETRVFFKSSGGDIDRAAARDGSPYTSQPYAMKYRESRDAACTCKNVNQTWAQATRGIEDIVEARKGDILVTPEKALALSRPKDAGTKDVGPDGKLKAAPNSKIPAKAPPKREETASEEAALPESALPTGGTASSGIGPKLNTQAVINTRQGKTEEVMAQDGTRKQVRVIVPSLSGTEPPPALKGATAPSTQAPSRAP